MLKVYQETTQRGQLKMGIQQLGNPGEVQEWVNLYKETAVEMGYSADGQHNAAARLEIGLIVCRKLLAS